MLCSKDFLERVDAFSLDGSKDRNDIIRQARYNLSHIPENLSDSWDFLTNKNYMNTISDNDAVIITRLGSKILLGDQIINIYMADNWELLGENFNLYDETINTNDHAELQVPRSLYQDDQWTNAVKLAKNILSKTPPENFIQKWPILASEEFRNRMKCDDDNAVIALTLAMQLSKNQSVQRIFLTYDWELLQEMINITRNTKLNTL